MIYRSISSLTTTPGGCGNFFEGTGEEMHAALSYLGTLPDETITYVGHEYTAKNAVFAKSAEPRNPDVTRLIRFVDENKITTGKTTIGDEKLWNVFMRPQSEDIKYVLILRRMTSP